MQASPEWRCSRLIWLELSAMAFGGRKRLPSREIEAEFGNDRRRGFPHLRLIRHPRHRPCRPASVPRRKRLQKSVQVNALQFVVYFEQKGISLLHFYEHTNDQIRIPGALPRHQLGQKSLSGENTKCFEGYQVLGSHIMVRDNRALSLQKTQTHRGRGGVQTSEILS